jgi:murein DD-endopeptidase MepM/ murein hydrolase activator NlpD
VGNSGTSTNPHLHIHVSTGASNAGSYPLLFRDVWVADLAEPWPIPAANMTKAQGRALPVGLAAPSK